jgi:DNA-binding response OmpR family regulator
MGSPTILLVDDSPLTLDALRTGLEAAGFEVTAATDLADVPRPLPSSIRLVLLDVEMAEVFGDDLAYVLQEDDAPPIYLVSALDEAELAQRARDAGVGWISKRDGVEAVVARARELLGGVASTRDLRAELLPRFLETAARRSKHARAELRLGARRRAAYELHALVGEAAVLGFDRIAALAQEGRHAVDDAPERCEDLLSAIDERVHALSASAPAPVVTESPVVATGAGGPRVLLLDDSDMYRATLRAILEDTGHHVVEAASLAECRALLPEVRCDLAIVDVELQDGLGTDLIPDIRAALPRAAVVVLSGGDAMTLPQDADLVLLKTLDPTTVLTKLERVLAHR